MLYKTKTMWRHRCFCTSASPTAEESPTDRTSSMLSENLPVSLPRTPPCIIWKVWPILLQSDTNDGNNNKNMSDCFSDTHHLYYSKVGHQISILLRPQFKELKCHNWKHDLKNPFKMCTVWTTQLRVWVLITSSQYRNADGFIIRSHTWW